MSDLTRLGFRHTFTLRGRIDDTAIRMSANAANIRATVTLALAARGAIEIVEELGDPWASLVEALLLGLLALGFVLVVLRGAVQERSRR